MCGIDVYSLCRINMSILIDTIGGALMHRVPDDLGAVSGVLVISFAFFTRLLFSFTRNNICNKYNT